MRNRLLALAGLGLIACAAPVSWFAHYFVDDTLGKCVASGARNRVNEGAFEVSSGAVVCLRARMNDAGAD